MAAEKSILKSTKKILGLDADYKAFDLDVITHINTAFFNLNQLGLGPSEGFAIEDDSDEWGDFFEENSNYHSIKTYVYLKVRSLFDPPGTPHHMQALKEQIDELEHRLKMEPVISRTAQTVHIPGL